MKKSFLFLKIAVLLFALIAVNPLLARPTGSFDASISFMSGTRKLSYFVPTNYDSTKAYNLMVCLHGLGDNAGNYRNALVGSGWPTNIPNTIFVCPEAATTTSDFYSPAGGEAIIQATIYYTGSNYHINTAGIILQGFSLGGRAALRYGLDNTSTIKGLLLNTPAIQGVKEALNRSIAKYNFAYENASKIPVYITHGMSDVNYEAPDDTMFRELVLNDGMAMKFEFPGLGHGIPAIGLIKNFTAFFDTPVTLDYDLDVQAIITEARTCNTSVSVRVLIRNTGIKTIKSATLQYSVNGTPSTYTWNGNLNPFEHDMVQLPSFTASAGNIKLDVKVLTLNGSNSDMGPSNNQQSVNIEVVTKGRNVPDTANFDGPLITSGDWIVQRAGDYLSQWFLDSTVHKSGSASIGAFNTILVFDNAGRRDDMISPVYDLSTASSAIHLQFDVAYNYHHYTPAGLGVDTVFADKLEVLASTDCGATWKSLYKKGGKDLATFHNPILNPNSIQADIIVPKDSNWRTEMIDLNGYSQAKEVMFKFSYISALGGSIYLDNFKIAPNSGINTVNELADFKIYPNPVTDRLKIDAGNANIQKVEVMDLSGRILLTQLNETVEDGSVSLDISLLPKGMYLVQVHSKNGVKTEKVMKK